MSSNEIYVSTDVEADGPIPGPNSMLSFGSAAYTGGKELIGTFSANLETLTGATADPKTAEWWAHRSGLGMSGLLVRDCGHRSTPMRCM
jgi:hypothetical protein